jgi:molybdopterin-containing oxidoreductase family membrane subunit
MTVEAKKGALPTDPLAPLIEDGHDYESITDAIGGIPVEQRHPKVWFLVFGLAGMLASVLMLSVVYLFTEGTGIWGLNVPVAWGFAIINFVWWIGIGHAGTLISAILLLFRQDWRTAINRFAEAMTLFAVACAGMFPLLHLGRPWLAFFIGPYPNTMAIWPQFRSPLVWDVFAVSTYGTVSLLFWYTGLIPDLASLRDRTKNKLAAVAYGIFALGWRGSARHWERYEMAYLLLAGLSTPLVVSVHSIVSLDFSVGIIPGWHTTIFPPYFVAGAVYSGFAMVLTLMIPVRALYGLGAFLTPRHIDNMSKVMLATGLVVAYGYLMEVLFAWYSMSIYEHFLFWGNRFDGPYAWSYWALIVCNIAIPQLLWFKSVRTNVWILWPITIVINIGMWLERYVIVVTSLHRDFMPSSWGAYSGTFWDWSTYIGTIGFFTMLTCLFVRFLPMIAIFEVRQLQHQIINGIKR